MVGRDIMKLYSYTKLTTEYEKSVIHISLKNNIFRSFKIDLLQFSIFKADDFFVCFRNLLNNKS